MAFTPATQEQRFVLRHVVEIEQLAATDRFAAASEDVVDAVLDGCRRVRGRGMGAAQPDRRYRGREMDPGGRRDARGVCRGVQGLCRGRLGDDRRARGIRRTGAAVRDPDRGARYVGVGEHGIRAVPDVDGGGDRGAGAPWQPRAAGALSAASGDRRMDGDDEPDRAAGGQRRRRAARYRHAAGRRQMVAEGHEDLHLVRRSRHGSEHRPSRAGAHPRCARGHAWHLVVPGTQVPPRRCRETKRFQRRPRGVDRTQDGAACVAHLRAELRRSRRLHRRADRSPSMAGCARCSR